MGARAAVTGAREAVRHLLGAEPTSAGSSVVTLDDGRRVMAKRGAGPGANAAEAAGLRWLATGDVPVPEVYAHDETWLLMEYVPSAQPTPEAARAFGRGLVALHLRGAPAFGAAPPDGPREAWIGLAPMHNTQEPDWPTFYATHRIEPYLRSATDKGLLDAAETRVIGEVCERIDALAGPAEPPARLHGDAWSGNLHWASDALWLIDPAAHGGHRETDLAMMRLFGAPLLDVILDAYAEAAADAGAPLADGWRERTGLHQLFPLLVLTVLFGGGYARQAVAAARSALALA
ncbi:MAG: phosphotransferase [Actinophytocola sp.]|nr:phosphotransferase [Actinophytocola sp.]